MNKKFIASTVLVALMFIAMYGYTPGEVEADRDDSTDFVKKLSEKFNLNEEEVSTFIQEIRADRFAERQEYLEQHLQLAVERGELTEELKQEMLDLHSMHIAEIDSYSSLSVDERVEMMQDYRDEMKIWADENGVDLSIFQFGHHRH